MTPGGIPQQGGGGEITLGELGRRVADVQATVHDLRDKLERDYVRSADLAQVERRLTALEATQTWVVRIVLGVVIVALLGLVVKQGAA